MIKCILQRKHQCQMGSHIHKRDIGETSNFFPMNGGWFIFYQWTDIVVNQNYINVVGIIGNGNIVCDCQYALFALFTYLSSAEPERYYVISMYFSHHIFIHIFKAFESDFKSQSVGANRINHKLPFYQINACSCR